MARAWRSGWAAPGVVLALAVPMAASAQPGAPAPVATTPVTSTPVMTTPLVATPSDVRQRVVPRGRAMRWTLRFRVPVGTSSPMPFRWVAYGGARDQHLLRRLAHGSAAPAPRNGVVSFSRRIAVPVAGPISGGVCVEFTGSPPCPDGATTTRERLAARVPEVTVISDSVGSGLDYVAGGRAKATGQWSAVFDLKVCRRLVAPPCPPNPPSALSVIESLPGSLGDVVLVHVGYNDWGAVYDIPRVMAALRARGVRRVVWLNLQAGAPASSSVNATISRAAGRYRWLQLADWSGFSAGHSWFVGDGDHLTPSGAYALAGFYRSQLAEAIRALGAAPAG